jgi:uncharacterized protein YkwD
VTAPSSGGTYVLEEQMVQESIAWFPQYLDNSVTVGASAPGVQYTTINQPSSFGAGGTNSYSVTLTNTGNTSWPATGTTPVHLAIHFATGGGGWGTSGTEATWLTNLRVSLPSDVAPGASITLGVSVTAPSQPGTYILEYQLVQENVAWFAQYLDKTTSVGTPSPAAKYTTSGKPSSIAPSGQASYSVSVTNTGNTVWFAGGAYPVHLGVHFAGQGGGYAGGGATWATDQRFNLPSDIAPGQSATLTVTVTAPSSGGTYVLEEQMVQESIAWFPQYLDNSVTVGVGSSGTCPGSQSACIQSMLNILNSDRAAAGVAPLTLNMTETNGTSSCVGSYGHSVHMSQVGSISHDQFPADICIAYSTAGENVGESASGNELTDLQSLDNQMMAEPHTSSTCSTTTNHACNIINPAFQQVGIGIYNVNNTTWLTEDFTN